jgi:hypothetical protein
MNGDNANHDMCQLKLELAVQKQKSDDEQKALVLAKDVASAKWASITAILIGLANLAIMLLRK